MSTWAIESDDDKGEQFPCSSMGCGGSTDTEATFCQACWNVRPCGNCGKPVLQPNGKPTTGPVCSECYKTLMGEHNGNVPRDIFNALYDASLDAMHRKNDAKRMRVARAEEAARQRAAEQRALEHAKLLRATQERKALIETQEFLLAFGVQLPEKLSINMQKVLGHVGIAVREVRNGGQKLLDTEKIISNIQKVCSGLEDVSLENVNREFLLRYVCRLLTEEVSDEDINEMSQEMKALVLNGQALSPRLMDISIMFSKNFGANLSRVITGVSKLADFPAFLNASPNLQTVCIEDAAGFSADEWALLHEILRTE